eukprot:TRINITY_DN5474_c0_g1_i7.p1 TRINITY_DN5474_c0_g1~~TRINITY_DN5474_c0_g1_i7.p1  ORF type:complete len:318 (-),score=77.21 TRINITY_DN5474_c0_g1_i7:347-1300(-)
MCIRDSFRTDPCRRIYRIMHKYLFTTNTDVYPGDAIEYMKSLKFPKFATLASALTEKIYTTWYFSGNITQQQMEGLAHKCETILKSEQNIRPLPRGEFVEDRVIVLEKNHTTYYEQYLHAGPTTPEGEDDQHDQDNDDQDDEEDDEEGGEEGAPEDYDEKNSAVSVYYQLGPDNLREFVMMEILDNLFRDSAFAVLRTNEQLGYTVWAMGLEVKNVLHFMLLIQSSHKSPQYLYQRIQAFFQKQREDIAAFTEEKFQNYLDSVMVKLSKKDLSLDEEAERYWREICNYRHRFNLSEEIFKVCQFHFIIVELCRGGEM